MEQSCRVTLAWVKGWFVDHGGNDGRVSEEQIKAVFKECGSAINALAWNYQRFWEPLDD